MIYKQTKLNIIDNSGGLTAKCIHQFRSKKKGSKALDKILVTLKTVKKEKKLKKKELVLAVIAQTKAPIIRKTGEKLSFSQNSIILINSSFLPLGNRVTSPIISEFRQTKFMKIVSISSNII